MASYYQHQPVEYRGVLKEGYKLKKKTERLFKQQQTLKRDEEEYLRDEEGYLILEWSEDFKEKMNKKINDEIKEIYSKGGKYLVKHRDRINNLKTPCLQSEYRELSQTLGEDLGRLEKE